MTTIILVRHGHVDGIRPARFRGRQPLPLSKQGRAEAEMTARRIASSWRPAAIYTSSLQRCVATGAAIGRACGVEPIATTDLDDLDYGDWQWKTYEDVEEKWPQLYAQWFSAPQLVRFPNGESLQDIVLRSANALRRVVESFPTDAVVLVGHESVNRALLLQLLDQPLSAILANRARHLRRQCYRDRGERDARAFGERHRPPSSIRLKGTTEPV